MKILSIFLFVFVTPKLWALPSIQLLQSEYQNVDWESALSHSVVINAPLDQVWAYASDSSKAKDWSVFFDHISPLPGTGDGQIGALRRCFRNREEAPPYWDEIIILLSPQKLRVITTYNLTGFKFEWLTRGSYVFVRQLYRSLDDKRTELTFQTNYSTESVFVTKAGFFISKRDTLDIFKKNLTNIKLAIEGKPRLYPWDKTF